MSGTRPTTPTPAEHHLGDRLAALVDGELGHDARERVLSHLATCARCKAEADAQRSLKSVFASTAPPPPSEGFLARLQGLPGGPGETGGPRGSLEELLDASGLKSDGFATAAVVTPGPGTARAGFRIHEVGDRGTSGRGRRFAFAAASAVSFAAIALGGTLPLDASVTASGRAGQGSGSAVTPLRATTTGGTSTSTGAGRSTRFGERSGSQSVYGAEPLAAATPGEVPLGPVPATRQGAAPAETTRFLTTPLVAARLEGRAPQSFFALSPFMRPADPVLPLTFAPGPSPMASPTTGPLGSHH
ncbi:anti-sigma factor family protein [Streptomyces sp. NPDC058877]|uniref:anti-sigma factor family protein n=1 Tax=unclassified Streptomyces TaxID=2593676 RepID=UPI003687CD07